MLKFSVNKVIKHLILFDLATISGWGLLSPIFAIFITKQIAGGSLLVVGLATAIYWLVKSIAQWPIARYLDETPSENDDFYSLVMGSCLVTIVPFGYIFASLSWHIYLLEVILAIGEAMVVPAWYAIFTRHVNKFQIGREWTLDSVSIGLGTAVAAALGSWIANRFGFPTVFVLVGMFSAIGFLMLLGLTKHLLREKPEKLYKVFPEEQSKDISTPY